MADPMRVRAVEQGGVTDVKILMRHDMETGLRKDAGGKLVAAHFIQHFSVRHKEREVFTAQFGPAMSRDPFIGFRFRGASKGDRITVSWTDNLGRTRTDETVIA